MGARAVPGAAPGGCAIGDRPVDLHIGPDGAMYVADFYNRIIGHYEVPLEHPGRDRERARIWRITYKEPNAASSVADRAPELSTAPIDARES